MSSTIKIFILFAALTSLAAAVGGYWTGSSVTTWYPTLVKPFWTPPPWVFGPAWTLLYAMMTIAAWRVWRQAGWTGGRTALILFFVQLILNAAWSGIFFGMKGLGAATIEILVLWVAILGTLIGFWRIDLWAGILLVPYLLWVGFASALTFVIWRLNP